MRQLKRSGNQSLVDQHAARLLLRLALPNLVATFIIASLTVIEGWHIGSLGTTALAGVAFMFPIYMLTNMLSTGAIGGAVSGAAARAAGAQNQQELEAVLRSAILIAICGGIIMSLLLWWLGERLFVVLGARDEVLSVSLEYARTFSMGLITLWCFNMICAVLRGAGDMRGPALGATVIATIHFFLCPLLVFGNAWVQPFDIAGAAAAITLAYLVGLLLAIYFVTKANAVVRFKWGPIHRSTILPIIKNGFLASNQSIMTIALALFTSSLVARLGTEWLAGYGIGIRLELLMIVVIFGIGGPLITIVGANVGAGQMQRALKIAWRGIGVVVMLVGGIGLFAASFPMLWITLFSNEPAVIHACEQYLRIVGPCYAFFALGLGLYFVSQAFQTMLIPVLGTAFRVIIVVLGGMVLVKLEVTTPSAVFILIAGAMVLYGIAIALSLRFGSWRPKAMGI